MAGFKDIVASEKPVLIDFYADWCGPCKTLAPIIQDVKRQLGDRAQVIKIDVDRNPQLASSLQIQGVPTLMIYQNGQMKWRQSGVVPANRIIQEVEKLV